MQAVHATRYMLVSAAAIALIGVGCAQRRVVDVSPSKSQVVPLQATTVPSELVAQPESVKPLVVEAPVVPEPPPHRITVLPVPFTVQAPYANWELPYQEACEEASMLMVADFLSGRRDLRLPPDEADRRILELVAWETEHGYPIDVTAAEVTSILDERFGLAAEVVPYDAARLRAELAAGRPVILPAAGRSLGNPYFHSPGPLYHMLVVKGYEGDEFIVNDPGTRRGESYRYHESVFPRAVHDWNGGDVDQGQQVMVVVRDAREGQ